MLTERDRGSILAALRFWQQHGPNSKLSTSTRLMSDEAQSLDDIATNGGQFSRLTNAEIDALCDRLNAPELHIEYNSPQSGILGPSNPHSNEEPCDCQLPGFFFSGVPGILAHVVNCRLTPAAKVERCDACQRYPTDEAALAKLRELGFCAPAAADVPNL